LTVQLLLDEVERLHAVSTRREGLADEHAHGTLYGDAPPANKVHGQRDQCNNQEDVDQTGRDVKGQES